MNNKVFGRYADYYNLLYKDKDYAGEAQYIHDLIQKHCLGAKTILNLGCGTGNHDFELACLGYDITGVDMSQKMLDVANSRLTSANSMNIQPSFCKGDIRNVRLGKTFDVVISLFHVMSYQITNDDLMAAISTAKEHLSLDGLLVFDCWYGPGVLTDLPAVRVKRLEDEQIRFVRIAEPVIHPNENVVDVNYQILITDKLTGSVEQLQETHRMRYLFVPELEFLLKDVGLNIVSVAEWMTDKTPDIGSWGACFVVKR